MAIDTPVLAAGAFVSNASATLNAALNQNVNVGDSLFVIAGDDGSGATQAISDPTGVNVYTSVAGPLTSTNNYKLQAFFCNVTSALTSGQNITLTRTGTGAASTFDKYLRVIRITSDRALSVDKTATNTGSGTAWDSTATATLDYADDLVLGAAAAGGAATGNVSAPAAGWGEPDDVTSASSFIDWTITHKFPASTTGIAASGTWSVTDSWAALVVAIEEVPPQYHERILDDAPSQYWRLGEASGTTAVEEVGTDDGTYVGTVTYGEPGIVAANTAVATPGTTGNEITLPNPAVTTTCSIEFWAIWRGGSGVQALMRDNTGGGGWIIGYVSTTFLAWRVAATSRTTSVLIADLQDGIFHHYVVTKNGATATLYVDGVQVDTGAAFANTAALTPWHLGRNGTQPTEYTDATYDEVAFYPTELTAGDVLAHYQAGHPPADTAAKGASLGMMDVQLAGQGWF